MGMPMDANATHQNTYKKGPTPTDESAAKPANGQAIGSVESQNVTSPGSGSQASQA